MSQGYSEIFIKKSAEELKDFCRQREEKNRQRIHAISDIISKYLGKELKGLSVLEYGCNTGAAIKEFALLGNRCVGVDVFKEVIDIALATYGDIPQLTFTKIEERLPFPDKTFDFVFSSETIEHVPLNKRKLYLTEFRRVMKDDGCGYISYPNFWFPVETHYFIPFHHWLQRIFPGKGLIYEDIPSKFQLRKELSRYFCWRDVSSDFLHSHYVLAYYPKIKVLLARLLSKTPFSIQDYLLLQPK